MYGFNLSATYYVALVRQEVAPLKAGLVLTNKETNEQRNIENLTVFVPYDNNSIGIYSKTFPGDKVSHTLRVDGEIINAKTSEVERVTIHLHGLSHKAEYAFECFSPFGLSAMTKELPAPSSENDIALFFAMCQALSIEKKEGFALSLSLKLVDWYVPKGKGATGKKPSPNFKWDILAKFESGAKLHLSHIWKKREEGSEEKGSFNPQMLEKFKAVRESLNNQNLSNDGDNLPF